MQQSLRAAAALTPNTPPGAGQRKATKDDRGQATVLVHNRAYLSANKKKQPRLTEAPRSGRFTACSKRRFPP